MFTDETFVFDLEVLFYVMNLGTFCPLEKKLAHSNTYSDLWQKRSPLGAVIDEFFRPLAALSGGFQLTLT
jgi:hypothetical protein